MEDQGSADPLEANLMDWTKFLISIMIFYSRQDWIMHTAKIYILAMKLFWIKDKLSSISDYEIIIEQI